MARVTPKQATTGGADLPLAVTSTGLEVRHLTEDDLSGATNLPVFYWSDSQKLWCKSIVEDPELDGERICLKGKPRAHLACVYVPVVNEQVSPREIESSLEPMATEVAVAVEPETALAPDAHFREEVFLPWLKSIQAKAIESQTNMAKVLTEMMDDEFPTPLGARNAMKNGIPWLHGTETSYVKFMSTPVNSSKGKVHASFLAFHEQAYPAKGIYLSDAIMLVSSAESLEDLLAQQVEVRPIAGRKPNEFGWESDGALVNGVRCFIISAVACWACLHQGSKLPLPLAQALGSIRVYFRKHEDAQKRLLQNLVDSQAQRFANRTILDPVFLSQEFSRASFNHTHVKGFVKLYRARTMVNGAMAMPGRVEDATVRLMQPGKIAQATIQAIIEFVAVYTWDMGPFTSQMLLAPGFVTGNQFCEGGNDNWAAVNSQTPQGQLLAVQVYRKMYDAAEQKERLSEEAWYELCMASAVWEGAREKLLPALMFTPVEVKELAQDFTTNATMRESFASLANKEPPATAQTMTDVASWMLEHVSHLKRAKKISEDRAKEAGDNLPSKVLATQEAQELNAANYVSALILDVDAYRIAANKLGEEVEAVETHWQSGKAQHVQDVKRFQATMQQSEFVIWEVEAKKALKKNVSWLNSAAEECVVHRRRVRTLVGCKDEDILQVNVFPLYNFGTLKKGVLRQIKSVLANLKGISIVFYPFMPRNPRRKTDGTQTLAFGSLDADEDDDAKSGNSDSDADDEVHDFVNGELPEALTASFTVRSGPQRAAQLSSDCLEVDTELGLANTERRYMKRLSFLHAADASGHTDCTQAMVLLPVDEEPGVKTQALAEATLCKAGMYTGVPVPHQFLTISKKAQQQAKRAMSEDWKWDKALNADSNPRFAAAKLTRSQLGTGLHQAWITDLIKTCDTKVLSVCTFASGSAEVEVAALGAKISVEAANHNVKVFSWSHDPRKVFHEVGSARLKSELGQAYMDRKLQSPGHTPVPDPGAKPERSRKLLRSMMGGPLKVLSLDADGRLIIPTEDEVCRACPVQLPENAGKKLQGWRVEFPRPVVASPAPVPVAAPAPGGGSNPAPDPSAAPGCGALVTVGLKCSGDDVVAKYKHKVLKAAALPTENTKSASDVELVLTDSQCLTAPGQSLTAPADRRVWLKNKSSADTTCLQVGTYLGRGGHGSFISEVNETIRPEALPFSWRYTRITSHKRDTAETANGFLVFGPTALTSGKKPNLMCLGDIEKEQARTLNLYGHGVTRGGRTKVSITPAATPITWIASMGAHREDDKFSADALAQWLPAMEGERSAGGGKFSGYHRCAFKVDVSLNTPTGAAAAVAQGAPQTLEPSANPNANSLHIFLSKKVELGPGEWFAMH